MPLYDDGSPVLAQRPPQRMGAQGHARLAGLGDAQGTTPYPAVTQFADADAFDTAQMARQAPSKDKGITSELLQAVRRFNITAAPPAHIQPTVWSTPIDISATVSVPAAVGNNIVAITYTVPKGYWARIQQYGVNVQDATYTYNGSLLWTFVQATAQVPQGLSNWGEQRGSMVNPSTTSIILQTGQQLQFDVRRAVTALSSQVVQMRIIGWAWPLRNTYEGTQASVTAY